MTDKENGSAVNEEYLFRHLMAMFQTLALQQLGKLVNPLTGELERDLQQARITIDMLVMIRNRTAGNLGEDEKRILDGILMDLQMNYVDELGKPDESGVKEEPETAEDVSDKGDTRQTGGN